MRSYTDIEYLKYFFYDILINKIFTTETKREYSEKQKL